MIALERKSTGTLDRGPRVPYYLVMPAAKTTRPVMMTLTTSTVSSREACAFHHLRQARQDYEYDNASGFAGSSAAAISNAHGLPCEDSIRAQVDEMRKRFAKSA